jgi:hypothetical protein
MGVLGNTHAPERWEERCRQFIFWGGNVKRKNGKKGRKVAEKGGKEI